MLTEPSQWEGNFTIQLEEASQEGPYQGHQSICRRGLEEALSRSLSYLTGSCLGTNPHESRGGLPLLILDTSKPSIEACHT